MTFKPANSGTISMPSEQGNRQTTGLGTSWRDARMLQTILLLRVLLIGRASLACENEAGGSWGQEVHILHVNI